ncbi:MAG: ABC transporter ATP-binding protein/permease [Oscillospiraceae bacterium]|jgi:ATP-binding cassette subfamily B protein|nr:ABC transporter ATP-binding protein/permease [Oscillospiraceae bacterium]
MSRNQDNPPRRAGRLRAFIRFYKPHRRLFAVDMACALVIALVDLAFPMVTRHALNTYLPGRLYSAFFLIVGAMGLGYVLRTVMNYVVTYFGHIMGVRMEADMRRDIFAQLQRLSFAFYDKNRTGWLMSRVTTDLFDITELAHHGPEDLFISTVTLVGAFMYLFALQWQLALTVFVMVPLIIAFSMTQRRRMLGASAAVKERMAGINADLESSISGARTAKAFANEGYEMRKFEAGNSRFRGAKGSFYSAMAVFHSGMELLLSLLGLAVLLVGGLLMMNSGMGVTELVTFNLFVGAITSPVRKLTNFMEMFVVGMAGFHRFMDVMDEEPDIVDTPGARALDAVRGDIRFEHVRFAYGGGEAVLADINLHIAPGRTLALVGPSGGGKTTLCQLIPRFYDVQAGAVLLDGADIRTLRVADLRAQVGIVQQDVFLFAGSVLENIRYGKVDATPGEVMEAARKAEIHEDILAMPEGYDTAVGERGVLLSGGQKQRVAIARVFLKNPPILILDEATSALDTATEARIQRAFARLAQGRTTLMIAHRLSTIRDADEIAVVDEHGIAELGTHRALLAQDGVYAKLYAAQFDREA